MGPLSDADPRVTIREGIATDICLVLVVKKSYKVSRNLSKLRRIVTERPEVEILVVP